MEWDSNDAVVSIPSGRGRSGSNGERAQYQQGQNSPTKNKVQQLIAEEEEEEDWQDIDEQLTARAATAGGSASTASTPAASGQKKARQSNGAPTGLKKARQSGGNRGKFQPPPPSSGYGTSSYSPSAAAAAFASANAATTAKAPSTKYLGMDTPKTEWLLPTRVSVQERTTTTTAAKSSFKSPKADRSWKGDIPANQTQAFDLSVHNPKVLGQDSVPQLPGSKSEKWTGTVQRQPVADAMTRAAMDKRAEKSSRAKSGQLTAAQILEEEIESRRSEKRARFELETEKAKEQMWKETEGLERKQIMLREERAYVEDLRSKVRAARVEREERWKAEEMRARQKENLELRIPEARLQKYERWLREEQEAQLRAKYLAETGQPAPEGYGVQQVHGEEKDGFDDASDIASLAPPTLPSLPKFPDTSSRMLDQGRPVEHYQAYGIEFKMTTDADPEANAPLFAPEQTNPSGGGMMQQSQQQGQAQQGGQQHVRHGSVGKSQQSQHVSHGSIGSGSQLGSGSGGTAGHLDFDDAPHEEKDVAEGTDDFSASYDARTERKISADQSVHTPDTVGRAITGNSGGGIGVAEASQVSRGGGATGSTAHAEDDDGPSRTGRMSSRRQGASSGGGGLGAMQDGEQEHQSEKSTREQQRGASVSHHAAATDPPQSLHLDDDDSAHHSGAAAASSSASLDPSDPLSSPILGSPVEWDADESLLEGGIQVIKLPRKSGFFGPSPRKVTMVLTQGSVSSTLKGQWLLHWASKKKTREEDFVNLSAMHGYQRGLDRGGFKDSKDLQREYAGREEQCFTLSIPSRELMIIVEKKSDAQALDRVLTRIAHPSGVHRTPSYIGAASPSKSKAKESTFQPGQPPKTPRSTRSGSPAGSPVSASQSPGASPPPKMAFPSFASSPVLAPHGSPKPGGLGLAAAAGGSRAAGVGAGQGSAAVGVGAATNVQAQVGSSPSIAQLAEHSRESSQASLSQQPARKSASLSAAQPAAQQSAN